MLATQNIIYDLCQYARINYESKIKSILGKTWRDVMTKSK